MADDIQSQIQDILRAMEAPDKAGDVVSRGLCSDIFIADGKAFFSLTVPADKAQIFEPFRQEAERRVEAIEGVSKAMVALTAEKQAGVPSRAPQPAPATSR